MRNKILQTILLVSFLFSLGEMPKGWDMPSLYQKESISVIGVWSIDLDKVIEEYRKTPEYKEAGEFAEMGVEMVKEIFSSMKFEFKDNGSYTLVGVPSPNGDSENFESIWYEKNGFIILESPNNNEEEDISFKLKGNDTLIPQQKNAGMFYLIREK